MSCPICNRTIELPVFIHDYRVCLRCRDRFTHRRVFAWLIDAPITFAVFVTTLFAMERLGVKGMIGEAYMVPIALVPTAAIHLLKDSIGGKSIGKRVLGLTVVSVTTGEPIGPTESVIRTLPQLKFDLSLPIGGLRPGDEQAGTRVVVDRRTDLPVFQFPRGDGLLDTESDQPPVITEQH